MEFKVGVWPTLFLAALEIQLYTKYRLTAGWPATGPRETCASVPRSRHIQYSRRVFEFLLLLTIIIIITIPIIIIIFLLVSWHIHAVDESGWRHLSPSISVLRRVSELFLASQICPLIHPIQHCNPLSCPGPLSFHLSIYI